MADEQSILTSVKKVCGIAEEDPSFDVDMVIHINSVFSVLNQLGVGPTTTFSIVDATQKWGEFLGDLTNIADVKSYMYLKVRLLIDPPSTSFAIESMQKQADMFEWRLNIAADHSASLLEF